MLKLPKKWLEEWWNKSKNLLFLLENSNEIIIPEFLVFNPWEDFGEIEIFLEKINWKVAVRSDSKFEDWENNSWAWVFETILNVENNLEEIKKAIEKIWQDSIEKVWEKIPVIIMEMVEDPDIAWVCFWIDSRNQDKNHYTINFVNWLWNQVVDWDNKTKTRIINKNYDFTNDIFSNLIKTVKEIEKVFWTDLLDIEFAIKNWKVYILQVRPLTALDNKDVFKKDKFISRVLKILEKKINTNDCVLWDMIDINPAELLKNTRKNLINTFFAYIFPDWPLIEARKELWYKEPENKIYSIIFNKFFVILEENLKTFLPNTLLEDEVNIFINYYKNLIKKNPNLQDKLDTIEYPNNIEIVKKVLKNQKISLKKSKEIIQKFNNFFVSLEKNLNDKASNYLDFEKNLIKEIFEIESWKIEEISIEKIKNISLEKLLEKIKIITKYFTIYARWAFYFRDEDLQEMKFFNKYKYSNNLNWKFFIPNWFDFLDILEVNFIKNNENIDLKNYNPKSREIFELARDNLKFLFMLLIWVLWQKIIQQLEELKINKNEIYNLSFAELLNFIQNSKKLLFLWEKRTKRAQKLEKVSMPPVLNNENLAWNYELLTSWTYIWNWKISWEIIYIENIKNLKNKENLWKLKGKILFLDTATPEIDSILPDILENVIWIVTKYWWPGAHITLRLREKNLERKKAWKKEIPLLVWLWDNFDIIKNKEKITLDFDNQKIW